MITVNDLLRRPNLRATPSQLRVLVLTAEGLSDTEIGARLNIAASTVGHHLQAMRDLWGCRTRAHLVAAAYQLGYLDPGICAHGVTR